MAFVRPLAVLPDALVLAAEERNPWLPVVFALRADAGPTWFLIVLLVFSLGYALLRAVRPPPAGQPSARVPGHPPLWGVFALAASLVAATALWHRLVPDGTYWPVVGLPTPSYLPQYLAMFALGVLAGRGGWVHLLPGRWALPAAALMVLGVIALVAEPIGSPLADPLFSVGALIGALLFFRRFANGPPEPFLAAQAFAVYVIHPPVVVFVSLALTPLALPAAAKATLLFGLAAPLCWLLAALFRAVPGAKRVF